MVRSENALRRCHSAAMLPIGTEVLPRKVCDESSNKHIYIVFSLFNSELCNS